MRWSSGLDLALHGLSVLFLGTKLAVLAVNAVTFPRLRREAGTRARVSVLIPARDEADNLRRTLPLLLAQGAAEVLVLDDDSADGTAEVARSLGVRVISGQPLPAGWTGKNWACWQLAQVAGGDILLFTDADVDWYPGALGAVTGLFGRTQAGLLTVWPRQRNEGLGERLLTPLLDDLVLCWFPAPIAEWPYPEASAAIGQVMMFDRDTYLALGGHAAVPGEVVEDVALARAVKRQGGRLAVALGRDLIGVRMYRSYPESVSGIAKLALPFHGGQRALLPLTWLLHTLVYLLPWWRGWRLAAGLGLLEGIVVRGLTGRTRPADLAEVALTPALPLLSLPVYWRALRRQVAWKRRRY